MNNLEASKPDQDLDLDDKARSQDGPGSKLVSLEQNAKGEGTETEKSDLFKDELNDDDADSEKRRERR